MEQGNSGSFKKYMHPLEESVLSLATGRIEKPVLEPPKDNVIPMTPRTEDAAPEPEQIAPVDKLQSVSGLINESKVSFTPSTIFRKSPS